MRGLSNYHKSLFASLILIAFGAVLQLNSGTTGTVLMTVGVLFLIVSIAFWKKAWEKNHTE